MKILDRYLLTQFLNWSVIGLGTFILLFVVVDLTEKIDVFVDYDAPVSTVLKFYAYSVTTIVTQVLPLALLLGALLSLGQLRKFNELTAMQSSGQSPWRLSRPLLIAALLISAGHYWMNEKLAADHYSEKRRIYSEEIRRRNIEDQSSRSNIRHLGSNNRYFIAQFYDARLKVLRNVSVQSVSSPGLSWRIDAEKATFQDNIWHFERGYYRSFSDSTMNTVPFLSFASTRISERPQDFAKPQDDPFRAKMSELLSYARRLEESGGETQKYMTNFHLRASYPLASLIMVFLGTGLSLRVIRGNSLVLGIGISVSVGFAYFSLIRVGQALGYNGTLSPVVAAWLGNVVFSLLGVFIYRKVAH